MRYIVFLVPALLLASCVTERRVETKYEQLKEAWTVAHPNEMLTSAIDDQLKADAAKIVAEEAAKERGEALAKGGEAAGNFASGNLWGGIAALLGLGGLGVAAYKKAIGGKS